MAVADLNYDNISDIAITNYGSGTIVVLFGIGDGTFLAGRHYSTGIRTQPHGVVVDDFNRDGQRDLLVAVFQSNSLHVWLGSKSQPFGGITSYSTGVGSQPYSVAMGDLDDNGRADLVVANYGTGDVVVFLQRLDGGFSAMNSYAMGHDSGLSTLALVDVNADHRLDIIVINSQWNEVAVLINTNGGEFFIGSRYSTGARSHPYSLALDDFNNDDILDIAVANSGTNNILLLSGHGNGTFDNGTIYPIRYDCQPYSIAAADLNQDSWLDIIVACYGAKYVDILLRTC